MFGGTKEKGNGEIQEYGLTGYLFQKKKKKDTYGLRTSHKTVSFHCLSKSPKTKSLLSWGPLASKHSLIHLNMDLEINVSRCYKGGNGGK